MQGPDGRREVTVIPVVLNVSLALIALALVLAGRAPHALWIVLCVGFGVGAALQLRRYQRAKATGA
jgi:hypothetical protein